MISHVSIPSRRLLTRCVGTGRRRSHQPVQASVSGRWRRCIAWLPPCLLALSCVARPSPAEDRLIRALDDPHWQVRASAAEALGRQGGERAVSALRNALADDSSAVRAAAVMSLGRLHASSESDAVRILIEEDEDRQVNVQALYALAALAEGGDDGELLDDVELLVEKMSDGSRRVRRAARRVLFKLVDRRELVERIRKDLQSSSKEARLRGARMAIELELKELAGWERGLVEDVDPEVRAYAYRQIRRDPDTDDLAVLLSGLKDASPRVRREAAQGLEKLADPAAVPALEEAAGNDASDSVREEAAEALAAISGIRGSALPALWHFELIVDRLELGRDGQCALTRSFTMRIDQSPEPIRDLEILIPPSFTHVDRVVDENGNPLDFDVAWDEDLRQLVLEVAPIGRGEAATFTFAAHSRRPVFTLGADEVLLAYSPGPVQAPVRALRVEMVLPGGGGRAIEPADLRFRSEAEGEVVSLDRADLSPRELEELVLRVAMPASALVLPRPPPRLFSRRGDLATAAAVVAVILACLAAVIVRLRRKTSDQADRVILVAVLTTGALLFITPILVEDNLPYYAVARSAVLDGDLDRVNEYTEFNQTLAYAPDNRGPLDPVFSSLFRTPFLVLAHGLTLGINAVSAAHAPNGFSFPYLLLVALGDFLAVLIGCLACFSLVERRVGRRYALFAVLAVFAGTNLLLFAYAWTSSSFQPSFLLFAVFLNYWDKTRDDRSRAGWLGVGLLLGVLGMTRTLNLGFVLLPVLDWIYVAVVRFKEAGGRRLARHAQDGALLTAGLVLGFAPQILLQRIVDDVWFVDAYGVGSGRFSGLLDNLWGLFLSRSSSFDGLLPAMPVLGLAFVGLWPLFRFDRRLGTLLLATLALQLFAIGSYEIYWGYFAFGTPYLVPSSPILCLAMGSLMRAVHSRWRRIGPAALLCVTVLFAARNGWCVLRQVAAKLIGGWQDEMGIGQVFHTLLLLDRKLDVDVLRYSSEFGCLLREIVGAVRARDFGDLLAALFWVSLLLAPILLARAAWRRIGRWTSRVPRNARIRFVIAAAAVAWMAIVGWLVALGSNTDLDYDYQRRRETERRRELALQRLAPGESFAWEFESNNPTDRVSVITFLDDAVDVPHGQPVATVAFDADGARSRLELRAGVDTADFAVDRPESGAERAHRAPLNNACFSWRVRDDSSHFYTARAYCSVFETPFAGREGVLEIASSLERGAVVVVWLTSRERKLPADHTRRRWLAERW